MRVSATCRFAFARPCSPADGRRCLCQVSRPKKTLFGGARLWRGPRLLDCLQSSHPARCVGKSNRRKGSLVFGCLSVWARVQGMHGLTARLQLISPLQPCLEANPDACVNHPHPNTPHQATRLTAANTAITALRAEAAAAAEAALRATAALRAQLSAAAARERNMQVQLDAAAARAASLQTRTAEAADSARAFEARCGAFGVRVDALAAQMEEMDACAAGHVARTEELPGQLATAQRLQERQGNLGRALFMARKSAARLRAAARRGAKKYAAVQAKKQEGSQEQAAAAALPQPDEAPQQQEAEGPPQLQAGRQEQQPAAQEAQEAQDADAGDELEVPTQGAGGDAALPEQQTPPPPPPPRAQRSFLKRIAKAFSAKAGRKARGSSGGGSSSGADDTAAEALCDAEVLVAKAALDGRQGGGKGGGRRAPVGCFPMFFK
ncbi:hypothetical protein Rsub_05164 [Raphidocelis subcapitata]|uniref:Uncharacterized protein n=1 Tax=Raphidocelis subcapitata TaxID=307507 RepID=A0A2V0P3X3_9CHLO|nr:hypothetical protein Rsub_05164 [Raphidocelis subcapitata]|eukprot:GBF92550.1 hypothetical protein Rsub_05164 [Raphidocelis subcapitata]